ncbi:MAG: hypothetical protein ACK5LX_06885 [Oscillospiraceae bacterium]
MAAHNDITSFDELKTAMQDIDANIEITFLQDVTFEYALDIPVGKTVVMKDSGNGQTLSIDSTMATQRHFNVKGNLTLQSGLTLDGTIGLNNPAGGGITVYANASLQLDGAVISQCFAEGGGGLSIWKDANAVMTAGSIEYCVAYQGGGVMISSESTSIGFTMSGTDARIFKCSTIPKDSSFTPQGGGVFINAGLFYMTGSSQIEDCIATGTGQGGGIFVAENGLLEFGDADGSSSPVITGCIAESKYVFNVSNQSGIGGGIFASKGVINLYPGSKITDNHSSNNGGGIYTSDGTTITMYGGLINKCTSGNAGGIFVLSSTFDMRAGTIENCIAYYQGGGITLNGTWGNTSVTIRGGATIQNCIAGSSTQDTGYAGMGGGVYVVNASLTMESGSTITGCSAEVPRQNDWEGKQIYALIRGSGGGIFADDGSNVNLKDGVSLTNNAANHHGGGIFTRDYNYVKTTLNVYFNGNTAAYLSIPADTVVNGSYPCKYASNISLTSAQLDNRVYPLNNYDINHISYRVIYSGGNGGVDTALSPSNTYTTYMEHFPYTSGVDYASDAVYTVLANDRSRNGNKFKFVKANSDFGAFTNYEQYVPNQEWFNTYGPDQAYDPGYPYPDNPNNPDQKTTRATQTVYNMYYGPQPNIYADGVPQLKYTALWTKDVIIQKVMGGDYGNLLKTFNISRQFRQVWGYPTLMPKPLSNDFTMGDGSTETITMYDDVTIDVKEDPTGTDGYIVTYSVQGVTLADETAPISGTLNDFQVNPVIITVTNTRDRPPPTGVTPMDTNKWLLLLIVGLTGALTILGYIAYHKQRRRRKRR